MNPASFRAPLVVLLTALLLVPATEVGAQPSAPAAASRPTTFKVTLAASRKNADIGQRIALSGTVTPAAKAGDVVVQVKSRHTWKKIATRPVSDDGAYRYMLRVTAAGYRKYRVVAPARGEVRSGVSPEVRITGWRWRYISDMDWHEDGDWHAGSVTIAGHSYPHSIYATNDFWGDLEVNLNGRCQKLAGVAGLDDDSETGSVGSLAILLDGSEVYSGQFDLTDSEDLSIDIPGTLRIAFNMETLTGSTFPDVSIGNARAYCRS